MLQHTHKIEPSDNLKDKIIAICCRVSDWYTGSASYMPTQKQYNLTWVVSEINNPQNYNSQHISR